MRFIASLPILLVSTFCRVCHADCELESIRQLHEVDKQWTPNAIIDVGANVGCWTGRARQIFPDTKFMMYEAFADFTTPLEKQKNAHNGMVDFKIELMSEKDGEEVQFWAEGTTGNSMFPQLMGRGGRGHSDITPVIRTTTRLDTARKASFLENERVDILKLDVQGAELTVLKGAPELLKEVSFVQFEASVVEYNKGGSCFYEVDEFLRHHGFYLYDFGDIMRTALFQSPGVGQFDTLYIRPTSENLPGPLSSLKPNLFCGSNRDSALEKTPRKSEESNIEHEHENYLFGHLVSMMIGVLIGKTMSMGQRSLRRHRSV
jgi:FkbM family methyltransferase